MQPSDQQWTTRPAQTSTTPASTNSSPKKRYAYKITLFGAQDLSAGAQQNSGHSSKIIEFYEYAYLYYVSVRNFEKAEQKFTLLEYYYREQGIITPNQPSFISLHLLYLFASGKEVEFYCMLENLDERVRSSPQVQKIIEFADMINLGNYATALDFAKGISSHHALVISTLEETKTLENCKLVDSFKEDVSIEDISRFFNARSQQEVADLTKYVDGLFEAS